MHGNKKVIEQLNAALASELTAIVQYMVQSETCQNWGYVRLGDYLKRRAIEEMGHAEGLIERIVFLGATPKVDVALTPKIGANVQQQLEGDLKDEEDAVHQYNSAMNVCAEARDNGSGDLFQRMLKDEEGHRRLLGRSASFHQGIGHCQLPIAAVAWGKIAKSVHAVEEQLDCQICPVLRA
jgi:bacterioferritin